MVAQASHMSNLQIELLKLYSTSISDDADFRILKRIGFPKLALLTADEFLAIIEKEQNKTTTHS